MSYRCVDVGNERQRRILTKLRGGTAELKEETGRWSGLPREERTYPLCSVQGIEDVEHFNLKYIQDHLLSHLYENLTLSHYYCRQIPPC